MSQHKFLDGRQVSPEANEALESLIAEDHWLVDQEKDIIRDCATVFAKASWLSMYLGLKLKNRQPLLAVPAQEAAMALLKLQSAFEAEQ